MTAETIKHKQTRTKRKIDTAKINQLLTKDLTQDQIAAIQGVHPSTITRYLQSLPADEIQQYKSKRIDKLVEDQLYAKSLNRRAIKYYIDMDDKSFEAIPEDKKIGLINASNVSAAVSYDKERLEAGQATNINDFQIRVLIDNIVEKCVKDGAEVCQVSESEANPVIDIPVIDGLLENLKDNK